MDIGVDGSGNAALFEGKARPDVANGGHSEETRESSNDIANALSWAEVLWILKMRPVKGTIAPLRPAHGVDNKLLPFFLIASLPQTSNDYLALAGMMDARQPLFTVYLPSERRTPENGSSVDRLADYYAQSIAEFRPSGPLAVGGWSAGGPIAEAVARRLQHSGREVRLLVIIDGEIPSVPVPPLSLFQVMRINYYRFFNLLLDFLELATAVIRSLRAGASFASALRAALKNSRLPVKWKKLRALFKARTDSAADPDFHPAEIASDLARFPPEHRAFAKALHDAVGRHVPEKGYTGDVLIFESTKEPGRTTERVVEKWTSIFRNARAISVEGSHLSIVKNSHGLPLARELCRHLRSASDRGEKA
ncbi:MAG TPA: thioesterase domain-containing protein [Rhizomicrobium sp.]|nr:thioesterase domain-containing protein [Rhizomicrobium sp.]